LYFGLLVGLRGVIGGTFVLTAVCYALSMVFNFAAQGLFTFRAVRLTGRSALRYTVVQVGALLTNSLAMFGLVDGLNLPLLGAQVCVTAAVALAVYFVSKHWVYALRAPS
ncbi:MAG: GtrA family protein, partial [Pseudomonadota bacterium]